MGRNSRMALTHRKASFKVRTASFRLWHEPFSRDIFRKRNEKKKRTTTKNLPSKDLFSSYALDNLNWLLIFTDKTCRYLLLRKKKKKSCDAVFALPAQVRVLACPYCMFIVFKLSTAKKSYTCCTDILAETIIQKTKLYAELSSVSGTVF